MPKFCCVVYSFLIFATITYASNCDSSGVSYVSTTPICCYSE